MPREIESLSDAAEHNILMLYRGIPNLQEIVKDLRLGFLNGKVPEISAAKINNARWEVAAANEYFDKNAYPIAGALYRSAFLQGKDQKMPDSSFLVTEGSINQEKRKKGESIENALFGFNLGRNPWQIYKIPTHKTLDDVLINENMEKWIRANIGGLNVFKAIFIKSSRIFLPRFDSISDKAQGFYSEGQLRLEELIPFIMGTRGYSFGALPFAAYPNRDVFQEYAPEFLSFRLKTSQGIRLAQLISGERGLYKDVKEILGDWLAFRVILNDEDSVYRFMKPFEKAEEDSRLDSSLIPAVRIGNYNVEIIYLETRYGPKKKDNGFQDYKMVVRFVPRKHDKSEYNGVVAEIQVTDRMSYYNHEMDTTHTAYHAHREKERERLIPPAKDKSRMRHVKNMRSSKQEGVVAYAVDILRGEEGAQNSGIFPPYLMRFDLSKYRKS